MARRGAASSKVCASIAAPSLTGMIEKAQRALSLGADLVEFRVDALEGATPSRQTARELAKFARVAVITVRSRSEGGGFAGEESERLALISRLAESGPAYLDVELATAVENPEWLRSLPRKVRRIVSWHDFRGTPGIAALRRIREKALEGQGSIAKLVTTATRVEDNLASLRLCKERPGKVVSFCMGELGSTSRLASMWLGAPIAYAALPNETVAPGQLSIRAMLEFRGLLTRR